jgi:biotin carboxyl carrier protein
MYKASVNNTTFEIEPRDEGFFVNEKLVLWDVEKLNDGHFHVIYGQKSFRVEVVKTDFTTKSFTVKVNGRSYQIGLKDQFDLLLEKMGMNSGQTAKINIIKAPMPGLIIDLKIKDGDAVKAGDTLLILEAMKMENIIKSPGEGVVKSIKVKKGDTVEKNQVLIEF